jgi:hypothetical protein
MSYSPEWGMGVIQRVFKLYLREKRGSRGQSVSSPCILMLRTDGY